MNKIDFDNFNKEDFVKQQIDRDIIFKNIAENIEHKDFKSNDVQSEILKLFNWMNKFYNCSIEMFHGLSEVYEFDPEFSDILCRNYGSKMPGYLSNAIVYFCNNSKKGE